MYNLSNHGEYYKHKHPSIHSIMNKTFSIIILTLCNLSTFAQDLDLRQLGKEQRDEYLVVPFSAHTQENPEMMAACEAGFSASPTQRAFAMLQDDDGDEYGYEYKEMIMQRWTVLLRIK